MEFQRYFIQEQGSGRLSPEHRQVFDTLSARGFAPALFVLKRLQRRQLSLQRSDFIFGDHDVMHLALKLLGIEAPKQNDYPAALQQLLHRKTWTSTLGAALDALEEPFAQPVFIKPAEKAKRFTGLVADSPRDPYCFKGASKHTPVFCSEVVEWKSEFRAYVCRDELLGMHPYSGDETLLPDETIVRDAIKRLKEAGENTAGYSLDFGVLATGETALVEMNDGFALGNYGLPADAYTELVLARWAEIV